MSTRAFCPRPSAPTGKHSAPDGCILHPRSAQAPARRQRGRTRSGQRGRRSPPGSPSHVDRAGRFPHRLFSVRRCAAGARRAVRVRSWCGIDGLRSLPWIVRTLHRAPGPARQRRQLIVTPTHPGPSASRFFSCTGGHCPLDGWRRHRGRRGSPRGASRDRSSQIERHYPARQPIPCPDVAMGPDHGIPLRWHRVNDRIGGRLAYEHRLARKINL